MRYFLISYAWSSARPVNGFGYVTYKSQKFPSIQEVFQAAIEENSRVEEISILSIYEFKNEQDYKDFVK